MGSTFLQLTNKVLRRINEVELTESNFLSTRGMQSLAKDAVMDAIREINQQKWQWPFLAVEHTQPLQIGENEYSWPDGFQSVDWNSFQLVKDENLPSNKHLNIINRAEWYANLKDGDEDTDPDGRDTPRYVFQSHGTGFGVSPSPNKEYTIEFRFYKNLTDLEVYDDVCQIPSQYDNVIIWGALSHMNLFRENPDGYGIADSKFKDGIKNMYSILVSSNLERITDTRVNFGGNTGVTTENFK